MKPCSQTARRFQQAIAAIAPKALDKGIALFQLAHHIANPNVFRRLRQPKSAARTTLCFYISRARKVLHNLGQMVARDFELLRDLVCSEQAVRVTRQPHQRTQTEISEIGKPHDTEPRHSIISIYNTCIAA